MKKVKKTINVKERLLIVNGLPKAGGYEDLVKRKCIMEKVGLTQEEIAEINLRTEEENITWDVTKDYEIEFTEMEIEYIKKWLKSLSDAEQLTVDHFRMTEEFGI